MPSQTSPISSFHVGQEAEAVKGMRSDVSNVVHADEFEYKDPVDRCMIDTVFLRFSACLELALRVQQFVFTLSNMRRISSKIGRDSQEALAPLVEVALKLSKMEGFTGRSAPTVIT
ncbi:unnamed protein product [Thlaspi arvense]|uniref:Uncharacterized protein n=1 Tax=Thlaspi arvense TaxID=13288 RepID=A0AAU9RRY5_THLAR|nr:unnamed protein product [Thlaspi arvense]